MEKKRELIEIILTNRVYLYELTHALFGGVPNAELMELVNSEHTAFAWSILSSGEGDLFQQMSEWQVDKSLEEMKSEYTKLLVGPGKLKAYPWASTYLGNEKMLFQESTLEVRRMYEQYGFRTQAFQKVADDHLAIELHFMAKMSTRAKEAFEKGDDVLMAKTLEGQRQFMKQHMLLWLPQYASKLEEIEDATIYPMYAKVLLQLIMADKELLESELFV
ncbi:MAG: TorD/DmsD family molecular chaperone [Cellulosilyticaceae bacterium]